MFLNIKNNVICRLVSQMQTLFLRCMYVFINKKREKQVHIKFKTIKTKTQIKINNYKL